MTRAHRKPCRHGPRTPLRLLPRLIGAALGAAGATHAATPLADAPVLSSTAVPGNLALALSVEFPTAVSVAHQGRFVPGKAYLGYFDTEKCYRYQTETNTDLGHFYPVSPAVARKCTAANFTDTWSGNFLNWLTMQAIDPFRWALTGGYRVVDTPTTTILERAWATSNADNGGDDNFPPIPTSNGNALKERPSPTAEEIRDHTPLDFSSLKVSVRKRGNKVLFTKSAGLDNNTSVTPTEYRQDTVPVESTVYAVFARVKVCESGNGFTREANCKAYASGYKPEGLLQEYADRIRFSALGYLNDPTDDIRDGGVLRARQKFVGPQVVNPGATPTDNAAKEWDASTGVLKIDPDSGDSGDTARLFGVPVANSGVLNYVNKFGQEQKSYKRRDPVSELYYGALRYLKNQGNVPAWSNIANDPNKARLIDGFPVITTWDDPIQYACQKNFILGIGDTNTNWDRNVPGSSGGGSEPGMPRAVSDDRSVNAVTATNKVGSLHGVGGGSLGTAGISNGSYLIAGLAYDANTKDIRPDDASVPKTKGKQTVQTYWIDVLEFGEYVANNQYYLATKYGGFTVPDTFDPYARSTDLPEAWWHTTTDMVGSQKRPDNYFTASQPAQLVAGLTKAFQSIASKLKAYTTSFQTSLPQISSVGAGSYSTQYDAKAWSGELIGSLATIDPTGTGPALSEAWRFSAKLDTQAAVAGSVVGWDTGRRMVTWNTETRAGVAFRSTSIASAQLTALSTAYGGGSDAAAYLNYLRGDRSNEKSSTATNSTKAYRDRATLLGDVVNAKARAVAPPNLPYSSATNPGYGTFKTTWKDRPTMVYVGTNAGVLHAVNGTVKTTPAGGGSEVFAYVPGALFAGPTSDPGRTGLAAIGNPAYEHRNYVDASPAAGDVDFGRTSGGSGSDWRSVLVGGLGKGGKAVYALDITDPASVTTEATAAGKVLWEFTHSKLGYTYGEPAIVKLKKHGWVAIFGSGYNNADGKGYLFIVNPRTGQLLEDPLPTGSGSTSADAGLAHVQAFVPDRTDGTADSVYAGDLNGKLWRFDLSAPSGTYPDAVQLAQLDDSSGNPLAVTSRPLVVVQPDSGRRWVTVGTGRLLDTTDMSSTQGQRYFAVVDGNNARVLKASELPTGVSWPFNPSKLQPLTNLTQRISVDFTSKMGWYIDLRDTAGSSAWRVTTDSTSFYGVVAFSAMLPTASNPCEPSGTSRVYAVDLGTGQSGLKQTATATPDAYATSLPGVVTDLRFFSASGKAVLVGGTDTGATGRLPGTWGPGAQLRRLNWREVPLAD